jgi:hypothetical protein
MRNLMFALAITFAVGAGAGPAVAHPPIWRACAIHPCRHCPKGEWLCNGKCIPKNQACRLIG